MSMYLVFAMAFAASAALPGPEIAALVSKSLGSGLRSTLALAVGITIGKLCMLTAAMVGLSALLAALGPLFAVIKYLGAAWLVWLGIRRIRAAGRRLDLREDERRSPMGDLALGMAMTLSNPMAIMFYLALLPGVVDIAGVTPASYLALCAIVVAVMAIVTLAYGLLAEGVRRTFERSAAARVHTERGAGALMIGVGAAIATR